MAERIVAIILFLGWAAVLWVVAIVKIARDGFSRFISHYTNWAWFFSAFLFTLDLISRVERGKERRLAFIIALFFYWVVNATCWLVFWLVWIALDNNPGLIEKETKDHGGEFESGFVFNMHALFHVLPSLMMLVYTVLRRDEIRRAVGFVTDEILFPDLGTRIVFSIIVTTVSPALIGGVYFGTTNVVSVYKLTVSAVVLVFTGLGVIALFNALEFLLFYLQIREKNTKRNRPIYTSYPVNL